MTFIHLLISIFLSIEGPWSSRRWLLHISPLFLFTNINNLVIKRERGRCKKSHIVKHREFVGKQTKCAAPWQSFNLSKFANWICLKLVVFVLVAVRSPDFLCLRLKTSHWCWFPIAPCCQLYYIVGCPKSPPNSQFFWGNIRFLAIRPFCDFGTPISFQCKVVMD